MKKKILILCIILVIIALFIIIVQKMQQKQIQELNSKLPNYQIQFANYEKLTIYLDDSKICYTKVDKEKNHPKTKLKKMNTAQLEQIIKKYTIKEYSIESDNFSSSDGDVEIMRIIYNDKDDTSKTNSYRIPNKDATELYDMLELVR